MEVQITKDRVVTVTGAAGRWTVRENGIELGNVFTTRRFGYTYWKRSGSKELFTRRADAISSLVLRSN